MKFGISRTEGERFASILFPAWGVAINVRQIRRLSYQLEALANDTADVASALQTEITSIAETLVQYRLALDFLLSRAGGFCQWLNQTRCCHFIDQSGRITTDIAKIQRVASAIQATYSDNSASLWNWLTSWIPGSNWLKELFVGLIGLLVMLVIMSAVIRCAIHDVTKRYSLVR